MADSKESLANDELTEDEIVRIAQQIPGIKILNTIPAKQEDSTKKILKAIGSENEQSILTDSDKVPSFIHTTKTSKQDENSPTGNVPQDKVNITPDLLSNLNNLAQGNDNFKIAENVINEPAINYFEVNNIEKKSSTIGSKKIDSTTGVMKKGSFTVSVSENQTENKQTNPNQTDANPTNEDQLTEMVPESMYSALQQRAQNVLKMIAEKKLSESSGPIRLKELGNTGSRTISENQTSPLQTVEAPNQLNEYTNSKTSNPSTKDPVGKNSTSKLKENNEPLSFIKGQNKSELSPPNIFQNKISSKLIKGNKSETNNTILVSESQQSTKSTEECTTDYSIKNKTDSSTCQKGMADKSLGKELKISNEKVVTGKISGSLHQAFSEHSTQAVFKELSQIIESNDIPEKLTKRGEIICYFFKQKLLSSLEASGTLDPKSAELVDVTSSKFANWMENILKEIDAKKRKKTAIDTKVLKEDTDEDEFVSASSSKESLLHKENMLTSQQEEKEEKPEVVKIQEISEEELKEKYGSYLEDETKHEVFNFVGPDEKSVEVKHLMIESNAKIMIVKKVSNDSQQSIWTVEVGPDITLDTVSGKVIKETLKEESEKESITILKQGEWNLEKIGWENWLPKVLAAGKIKCRKIPVLKKQCKLRDSDSHAEYPTYSPSLLALGTMDQSLLDGKIMFPAPPQTEPSAPQEP